MDKSIILAQIEGGLRMLKLIKPTDKELKIIYDNALDDIEQGVEKLSYQIKIPEKTTPKNNGKKKKLSKPASSSESEETKKYFIVGDESKTYTLQELKEYLHVYHSKSILTAVEKGTALKVLGEEYYIDEVKESV